MCNLAKNSFIFIVGEDFSGVPINFTIAGEMANIPDVPAQSVNITIFDDNIVENFEFINLRLTTENPNIVLVDQNVAVLEISDNDGIINYLQLVSIYIVINVIFPTIIVAIIDFEQFNYTFPEGSTGSVCVTIMNPVILGMEVSLFPRTFCMFIVHDIHSQS